VGGVGVHEKAEGAPLEFILGYEVGSWLRGPSGSRGEEVREEESEKEYYQW
jgi:hypothetical protein